MTKAASAGRGRGRPRVYTGKVAEYVVELTKAHGQTGAQLILNAPAKVSPVGKTKARVAALKAAYAVRDKDIVPTGVKAGEPWGITLPTIGRLAREAGMKFSRGRRAAVAA